MGIENWLFWDRWGVIWAVQLKSWTSQLPNSHGVLSMSSCSHRPSPSARWLQAWSQTRRPCYVFGDALKHVKVSSVRPHLVRNIQRLFVFTLLFLKIATSKAELLNVIGSFCWFPLIVFKLYYNAFLENHLHIGRKNAKSKQSQRC